MLNSLVPSGEYILYRKAIWLYLFFLIFEGALRKWFLPSLSTPLLLIRDPIVIWLVLLGIKHGWIKNGYAIAMMLAGIVSFLFTLIVGHQNLSVALFGWRIYFFYFPFIFVMGAVLTREDILKMGRFVLYLSIPMTILIVMQFYSPQSAWVNRGIGGDMEGAGFSGALGYYRPPGTFSFISGTVMFQLLVACFLFFYLLMNETLDKSQQIHPLLLWIMTGCYIITIPYSISRSHFFQTIVVIFFLIAGLIQMKQFSDKLIKFTILLSICGAIIIMSGIADDSIAAFTARFEGANKVEGGVDGVIGNRYLGSFLQAYNDNLPFWGYGLGLGTHVGTRILSLNQFYLGEGEWGRIVGECGLLAGWIILIIRCLFSLSVFKKALDQLRKKRDLLPWLLSAGMLLIVPQGQMGLVPILGFLAFIGGIALASVKQVDSPKN
jgi:hypothetical protein